VSVLLKAIIISAILSILLTYGIRGYRERDDDK